MKQISSITSSLIEAGVSVSQNFPSSKTTNGIDEISFEGGDGISVALKNAPYCILYKELLDAKCYNMQLVDGALLQFMYRFQKDVIIAHRLAFFPSPHLEDYQTASEIYEDDYLYGDVVRENITPFPIRFDFSDDETTFKQIYHSKTHLTLGEFSHCRIPVSAPLSPIRFVSFIMRHFYFEDRNDIISSKIYSMNQTPFDETLLQVEKEVSYFTV